MAGPAELHKFSHLFRPVTKPTVLTRVEEKHVVNDAHEGLALSAGGGIADAICLRFCAGRQR